MKIGIFDSGLGGLIITKAIHKIMPEYDYVYFGDTKRVPYGNRSQQTVFEFTLEAVDHLFRKENCAIIIIACNTASSRALKKIQQDYLLKNFKDRKILGVLIPTAEIASTYKKIGILATSGTVISNTFKKEIHKINKKIKIFQNKAPMLVPLIEEGENKLAIPFIKKYLQKFKNKQIEALILGCTHYPILKKEIKKILPKNIKLISQDEFIPAKLKDYLLRHKEITEKLSKNKTIKIITTDKTKQISYLIKKWFGKK